MFVIQLNFIKLTQLTYGHNKNLVWDCYATPQVKVSISPNPVVHHPLGIAVRATLRHCSGWSRQDVGDSQSGQGPPVLATPEWGGTSHGINGDELPGPPGMGNRARA